MTTRQKSARAKASAPKKGTGSQKRAASIDLEDVQVQEMETESPTEPALKQTPAMTSSNTGSHQQNPYVNTLSAAAGSHHQYPYVNTATGSTDFNSWLLSKTPAMNPQFSQHCMPMASRDLQSNLEIEARVPQIIATSATNISKGTSPHRLFPFKYVSRGHDKVKIGINSASALEHLWGIFAIIKDPTVPGAIKPALLAHMDEILEDFRWYDWESAVCPWSEEVFSLIAEGRLPLGWEDTRQIQMLRMTISRASTARIYRNREQQIRNRPSNSQPHAFAQQYGTNDQHKNMGQSHAGHEQLKGGLPCPHYNSQQGCQFPLGHNVKGKKMIHVCSYCITEMSAPYPHPVVNCRHKAQASTQHFY